MMKRAAGSAGFVTLKGTIAEYGGIAFFLIVVADIHRTAVTV